MIPCKLRMGSEQKLVWYSNGPNLSNCWMVIYSGHGLTNKLLVRDSGHGLKNDLTGPLNSEQVKVCSSIQLFFWGETTSATLHQRDVILHLVWKKRKWVTAGSFSELPTSSFFNCMPNDVTSVRRCWSSFR